MSGPATITNAHCPQRCSGEPAGRRCPAVGGWRQRAGGPNAFGSRMPKLTTPRRIRRECELQRDNEDCTWTSNLVVPLRRHQAVRRESRQGPRARLDRLRLIRAVAAARPSSFARLGVAIGGARGEEKSSRQSRKFGNVCRKQSDVRERRRMGYSQLHFCAGIDRCLQRHRSSGGVSASGRWCRAPISCSRPVFVLIRTTIWPTVGA
jgi:hypothetical protein